MWPGLPPESTGESFGSTAIISISGNFSFNTSPAPVIVPPVPIPDTNASSFKPSDQMLPRFQDLLLNGEFQHLLRF